ncbi:MAG: diguanylate cyclase [Nitrospinota bacterium]
MEQSEIKVLAVDKDKKSISSIKKAMAKDKFEVVAVQSQKEAEELLNENNVDLIIADSRVSGGGIKIIEMAKEQRPQTAGLLLIGEKAKKGKDVINAFAEGRIDFFINKPINDKELTRFAELAVAQCAVGKKSTSTTADESGMELENIKKELEQANEKITAYTRKIGVLTLTDVDTKLYNRKYFEEKLNDEFERSMRYNSPLALIALNIDEFKKINEEHGSSFGDEIIREIGGMLKSVKRNSDVVARFGGVEFAVLLPEIGIDNAKAVAERFRQAVESRQMMVDGKTVKISTSGGVAAFPSEAINSPGDLLQKAGEALQHAIGIGMNRVVVQTAHGMVAMGEGETVTVEEKAEIKRSIVDFVSTNVNLEEICSYLLSEINRYFARDPKSFYGSVYVVQDSGNLSIVSSFGRLSKPVDVENLTRNAAYSGMSMVTKAGDREHPFSTIPILGTARSLNRHALAVLNINKVVRDREYFNNLLDSITIALRDAAIRQDIDELTKVIRGM